MSEYAITALEDLHAPQNSWTKGKQYNVTETDTKFQLTSNEAQVAYVISAKDQIMKHFNIG